MLRQVSEPNGSPPSVLTNCRSVITMNVGSIDVMKHLSWVTLLSSYEVLPGDTIVALFLYHYLCPSMVFSTLSFSSKHIFLAVLGLYNFETKKNILSY